MKSKTGWGAAVDAGKETRIMTVDLRAFDARTKAELGWGPAFPTYGVSVARLAHVLPALALRGRG